MNKITLEKIAAAVGGRVVGESIEISGVSAIDAGRPDTITFLANPKYARHLSSTGASAAIVGEGLTEEDLPYGLPLVVVADPYLALAKVLAMLSVGKVRRGVESGSFVHETAVVGAGAYVGAFAYVGEGVVLGEGVQVYPHCYIGDGCRVGAGTVMHSGVKVYAGCSIGSGCVLHSGSVIGSDGFGFAGGEKVPQIGDVIIGDLVEVGANTTIDRATFGSTRIADGVKLDNLIQVAHNVSIGERTFVAAQTGIAGSTKIGCGCVIGGQVGIAGHITVSDGARIAAQSGVSTSLESGETVQGSPAMSAVHFRRSYVGFRNLSDIEMRVRELERIVNV